MTTKARKKRKSLKNSSDGHALKVRAARVNDNSPPPPAGAAGTEDMAARIDRGIEGRLSKIETTPAKRTKSVKKPAPGKAGESAGTLLEQDTEIPVRKIGRSVGPVPSEAEAEESRTAKRGIIEQTLSLLPGARSRDYDRLIDTLERMDEFGKVPDVENKLESLMMFLYEKYWRVETAGLENIPNEGRTLIVSNHSGVLPFDGAMMATAIYKFHPSQRYARFLIEDWFG
ncbi:MAG: hypothetical protein JSV16_10295, partial [Candidatus Hydrogenedentota bacterium]